MTFYNISNFKTKLGYFSLISNKKKIISFFPSQKKFISIDTLHKKIKEVIEYYFSFKIITFKFETYQIGTLFEKKVREKIAKIGYGATKTYSDIAKLPKTSASAIGHACSKIKCLVIIPCHRIICSGGKLGRYVLGKKVKKYLINLENDER